MTTATKRFTLAEYLAYDNATDRHYELVNGENEDRDYRYKRSEYAARGIAEYWIVNPE